MKYKNDEIKEDWFHWLNRPDKHKPFMLLYYVVSFIDDLSKATGHGEITITSFLRLRDMDSYHSKAQAADIRLHDKTKEWYEAMIVFRSVLSRLNWQIQLVPHLKLYNTPDEHIHIEIDDGSLHNNN